MTEPNPVKRRTAAPIETPADPTIDGNVKAKKARKVSESKGFSILDILKIFFSLITVSSALSWFITGDSVTWGYSPWWTKTDVVLRYFVRISPPSHFMNEH
jgi:hypothetical protein